MSLHTEIVAALRKGGEMTAPEIAREIDRTPGASAVSIHASIVFDGRFERTGEKRNHAGQQWSVWRLVNR